MTLRDRYRIWMAAARAAHARGDCRTERWYRDTARLQVRKPPLSPAARCLR